MDWFPGAFAAVIAVIALIFAIGIGWNISSEATISGCDKIGVIMTKGRVFDCKART